jgi:hypothetical protein
MHRNESELTAKPNPPSTTLLPLRRLLGPAITEQGTVPVRHRKDAITLCCTVNVNASVRTNNLSLRHRHRHRWPLSHNQRIVNITLSKLSKVQAQTVPSRTGMRDHHPQVAGPHVRRDCIQVLGDAVATVGVRGLEQSHRRYRSTHHQKYHVSILTRPTGQ